MATWLNLVVGRSDLAVQTNLARGLPFESTRFKVKAVMCFIVSADSKSTVGRERNLAMSTTLKGHATAAVQASKMTLILAYLQISDKKHDCHPPETPRCAFGPSSEMQ